MIEHEGDYAVRCRIVAPDPLANYTSCRNGEARRVQNEQGGMSLGQRTNPDVTVVLRTRDDEERVGHALRRIAEHLRAHKWSYELLVADEDSGDNTVAIAALLHRSFPEVEVLHTAAGEGYYTGSQRARGRAILLLDARCEAPLSALGFALGRLDAGTDVVSVGGTNRARYLVMRRTRAWRAFDALVADAAGFVRRARALGLKCLVTHEPRHHRRAFSRARFTVTRSLRRLGQTLGAISIVSF